MTSASKQEPRRVFTELHNTLPRSSKSEDDLLSRGHKSTRTSITSPVKEKKASAAAVNTTPSNHITDEKKVRLMQYYLFTIIRYIHVRKWHLTYRFPNLNSPPLHIYFKLFDIRTHEVGKCMNFWTLQTWKTVRTSYLLPFLTADTLPFFRHLYD